MSFYNKETLTSFKKIIVAYSGGLDSHCLLHMLAADAELKTKVYAVHINHNLSPNTDAWEAHCQRVCATLGIPLQTFKVNVAVIAGESIEAAARAARYTALAAVVGVNEVLVTAQHRDDQAETMLLQLFRGAGVKGLAAMPKIIEFAAGWLLRPLLDVSRQDLLQYAQQQHLQWIEDESNTNTKFDRNYLHHEILPLLKQRWPSVTKTIARSSEHCAQAAELLKDLAMLDLQACLQKTDTLSIETLMTLSAARQVNVLRYWLYQQTKQFPDSVTVQRILEESVLAKVDACPEITWNNNVLRRFKQHLYFLPEKTNLAKNEYTWNWQSPLVLDNIKLTAVPVLGYGLDKERLPTELTIKFRVGGEKIKPQGRQETHTLKNLFQEWGIPPWQRDSIPLIFVADQLIAVVGYCYHHDYRVIKDKIGIILEN